MKVGSKNSSCDPPRNLYDFPGICKTSFTNISKFWSNSISDAGSASKLVLLTIVPEPVSTFSSKVKIVLFPLTLLVKSSNFLIYPTFQALKSSFATSLIVIFNLLSLVWVEIPSTPVGVKTSPTL